MNRRVQIIVRGLVQGVGFRMYTQWEAKKLALHGFVRNLPNGNVEIIAEGGDSNIDHLVEWARHGPPSARVDEILIDDEEATGEFGGFSVRH